MYQPLLIGGRMAFQEENSESANVSPLQRKTTLKWKDNGELSAIDMARILSKLNNADLTACDFACELDQE
tara:strand:+ start:294 stop:503 length:210 start_codon:yes stop_codon:yes gene_type:complete